MILLAASLLAAAETVTHPRPVPAGIPADVRPGFQLRATALETRAVALDTRIEKQATECGAVSSQDPEYAAKHKRCSDQKAAIETEWKKYDEAVDAYHADLDKLLTPPTPMPEAAAAFMKILEDASHEIDLPKVTVPLTKESPADLNCQALFRAVGRRLDAAGADSWTASVAPLKSANEIAAAIAKDQSKWRRLAKMDDAQALANRGVIVVGASIDKKAHGHLGFVLPLPPDFDASKIAEKGSGPFVRDGNRHAFDGKTQPSTWGAIRASRAFALKQTSWYVWIPSE